MRWLVLSTPLNPAVRAKGTVSPSDIPIIISFTKPELVLCGSLFTDECSSITGLLWMKLLNYFRLQEQLGSYINHDLNVPKHKKGKYFGLSKSAH